MKIRKAKLKDLDGIMQVYYDLIEHHVPFDDCFWTTKELARNWRSNWKKYAKDCIQNKKKYVLVSEEKGKILGFIIFEFKKRVSIFIQNDYLYISDLAVSKGHRRKGIGSKLIKEAITSGKRRKVFAASVHVRTPNKKARKFYSQFGFYDTMVEMVKKM